MSARSPCVASCSIVTLLSTPAALAQAVSTASVIGTVRDSSGAVLPVSP